MTWNYRVIDLTEQAVDGELLYGIVEVYYDEQGNPEGYTDPFILGDSLQELEESLQMMFKSIQKPTLNPKDFLRSSGDEHEDVDNAR